MEDLLQRRRVGRFLAQQLALRGLEVEGKERGPGRSLVPSGGLLLVGDEAVEARPKIGSERALLGVVAVEEILLERAREESLRQVLGVLVGFAEPEAQVLVRRPPVRLDENREATLALDEVGALRREDGRVPRCRKSPASGPPMSVSWGMLGIS
jgi:hypothetical protein